MIETQIGRYRLVGLLGKGGMGEVWKAEDTLLGRPVALKLLSAELAGSDDARKRFIQEARSASALDHPGVATVYDAGQDGDRVYISFRMVDGRTVRQCLERSGPFPVHEALRLAEEAAAALAHAHAHDVLHRDVSARNLMVDRSGKAVVVDFGLALLEGATRLTRSGQTMGTVVYMPPEIVNGARATRQSDVYSLGIVLYEMLAGHPPFDAERVQTLFYKILHNAAPPIRSLRPDVPPEAESLLARLLEKDPSKRPATMEEVRRDLAPLAARAARGAPAWEEAPWRAPDLPPAALAPDESTRSHEAVDWTSGPAGTTPPPRRRRVLWLVAAGVALAAAGGGGYWLLADRGPATFDSVAVLPFRISGTGAAAESPVAEGLGESLATKLTSVSGLRVTPWMSSRHFRDPDVEVERLTRTFGVQALLTGTLREDPNRLRGSIALVDGATGQQIWASDFDEPLTDVFEVQNRIAVDAARRLRGALTGEEVQRIAIPAAHDVEAYNLYLRAAQAIHQQDPASADLALGLLRRAIQLDPGFARAHVPMGSVYGNRYFFGWQGGLENVRSAVSSFERALAIDPDLVAAQRGLILVKWETEPSEELLKRGAALRQVFERTGDPEALQGYAESLVLGGFPAEAVPQFQRVLELDPASRGAQWYLTVGAAFAGQWRQAVAAGEAYFQKFGQDAEVHLWLGVAREMLGDMPRAGVHYGKAIELLPPGTLRDDLVYPALFFRRNGEQDKADTILLDVLEAASARLERWPDHPRLLETAAQMSALLGDAKGAAGYLQRLRTEFPRMAPPYTQATPGVGGAGDVTEALRLAREGIHLGCLMDATLRLAPLWAGKPIEALPGGRELLAQHAAALTPLRAKYVR